MPSGFFEFRKRMASQSASGGARRPRGSATAPGAKQASADERAILSVSQLTLQLERTIKLAFPTSILVRGEVSNHRHHSSGHLYFTLKDSTCCIDCVMWRSDAARLKFEPEDGMELLVTARMGVYGQRGQYQLYVSRMEPLGQGALEIAFAQLKAKLEAEGLFDPSHKRAIPRYPRRIVLLTGRSTAALADMLKVLRRFPFLQLWVYDVPVQGDGAASRIADALDHLGATHNAIGGIDVILLARGGGSLEDLWAFNEEPLTRAIYRCPIPVVTGIGHEIDICIADLVADLRAHTPTEAASVVTAGWNQARDTVEMLQVRARRALRTMVQEHRQWLNAVRRHELFRRPSDRVNMLSQGVDDRRRDLDRAARQLLQHKREMIGRMQLRMERNRPSALIARQRARLDTLQRRLSDGLGHTLQNAGRAIAQHEATMRDVHPRHRITLASAHVDDTVRRLNAAMATRLARASSGVSAMARHLNAVGPQQVLRRGYSMTTLQKTGALLRSAAEVRPGDRLLTHLADGTVQSTADDPRQPGLFD